MSSGKSKYLHVNVLLLLIAYKVSAEGLSLMTLKNNPNFEKKTHFLFEKWHNLVNFNSSSGKSENVLFDGTFLSEVCKVWAKKIQTSCVVKNGLWIQK